MVEVPSVSAAVVMPKLESIFSLMGIPKSLKTDNGPPFNGFEFGDWCRLLVSSMRRLDRCGRRPMVNAKISIGIWSR